MFKKSQGLFDKLALFVKKIFAKLRVFAKLASFFKKSGKGDKVHV